MGGEAEATATEVAGAGAGGKRLYPMTTMGETPVAQPTPDEMTGGGLKRPGDEALGVEGEGGSMFKMPRLDEMESSAQYQIPEAGEEDVSDDEGHVSGQRNGIASGRWSDEEHQRFLQGMEKYGRAWRIISKRMVKTRTAEQVRIHAQKYFYKQAKKAGKNKPTQDGHWTNEEHEVFLELYDKYGRSWKKIAETMKTRSNEQVRTHAQKYFSKLEELRDRGYQGRYNMDGKRHLTKSFLMNGPLSPDTPTAATMMMVNPAAVARLSTGAPTTGPGKSAGAVTGKSSGKRASRRGSDDEELDYDPSLESDKRRSSLAESRTMTYTSRSGRQVTTRKWDEELLGDEEEEEDDDDEPGEEDHEAMLQLVRGNRGMPPSLFPPSAAAAMMVMPPGAAALMMGGPLGMPPVMPLVPPAAPAAPQPAGTAEQEDEDDDVIYTEDEEEDAAAQDDKAAETLLFWQQSQASGQESNDGSMLTPNAAPPLPPNDTSMAQALAGSPEPHTNMLTSTAPVEMLAAHDDNPPPTSEYPGSLLMMQPSVSAEEAVPLEAPPQPEPPTVQVLPPAQAPVPDPTPEERARGVMVVQQPLPLPPPPIDVEQPDSTHATPVDPASQPSEGVQGMGSLDSPSSVHEMESAQALLSWQG